jgi:hypothetical protein
MMDERLDIENFSSLTGFMGSPAPDRGRATLNGEFWEKTERLAWTQDSPPIAVGGNYDESLQKSKIKRFDGLDKLVLSK